MRRLLIAATAAVLMAVAAPALAAEGPAGTSEGSQDPETGTWTEDNQVSCGTADADDVDTGTGIQVKTAGDQSAPQDGGALVVCNDGTTAPVQGRVIAAGGTEGGYVAADGDADNSSEQAQGWARADIGSSPAVGCGDATTGDTDAANPAGPLSTDTCG